MGRPTVRAFYVSLKNTIGSYDKRGPFMGSFIPTNGALQISKGGAMVSVDARLRLPLVSGVRPGSIVRDLTTNLAYEVEDAKTWADHIEVFVNRSQADL